MNIAYVVPLVRAWDRMKAILFSPFDLVKWFVIGFAAWLAGFFSTSNGWTQIRFNDPPEPSGLFYGFGDSWEWLGEHPIWIPVAAFIALGVLVIFSLLLWVSSRCKMIFLDNVVHNRAEIVEPWQRLSRLGDSLFIWRLSFSLICFGISVILGLMLFGPAAVAQGVRGLEGISFAAMGIVGIAFFTFGTIATFILLFLDSFIVPIMYKYNLTATKAWRYFMPWLSTYGGWFLVYGLFLLLLVICFFIAMLILLVLTCCVGPALIAIPYLGTVILLPLLITYRAFSIEFLAQLNSSFDLFAEPIAASSQGTQASEP